MENKKEVPTMCCKESVNATNKVASKKQFKGGIDCWDDRNFLSGVGKEAEVRKALGNGMDALAFEFYDSSILSDYLIPAEGFKRFKWNSGVPISEGMLYTNAFVFENGVALFFSPWNKPTKNGYVFVGWFYDGDNDPSNYDFNSFLHTAATALLEGDCVGKTFLYCDC